MMLLMHCESDCFYFVIYIIDYFNGLYAIYTFSLSLAEQSISAVAEDDTMDVCLKTHDSASEERQDTAPEHHNEVYVSACLSFYLICCVLVTGLIALVLFLDDKLKIRYHFLIQHDMVSFY